MSLTLSSPITGSAQTGFTSPTYTLTADTAPDVNAKQWAVSAVGGTQIDVNSHTANKPFTVTLFRPKTLKILGFPNAVTGILANVPKNAYKVLTRKGVQNSTYTGSNAIMTVETIFNVPAGDSSQEVEELKAAISCHIGALTQLSAELGATAQTGIF